MSFVTFLQPSCQYIKIQNLVPLFESLFVAVRESFISCIYIFIGCSAYYIGETKRHFTTRIREHISSNKHSHIFKHPRGSENCRSLCSEDCIEILDSAFTSFQLKIKSHAHPLGAAIFKFEGLNLSLSY